MNPVTLSEHIAIRLVHSDAAGVLFYPRLFEIEQDLFERWLECGGFSLREMLDGRLVPTPVVHCEADYRLPIRPGDRILATLAGVGVGRSGYALAWNFTKGEELAASVRVKRVAIDPRAQASTDLPEALRHWLLATQAKTATL
jgi:acyl-CoA thioesterase FadM